MRTSLDIFSGKHRRQLLVQKLYLTGDFEQKQTKVTKLCFLGFLLFRSAVVSYSIM